MKILINLIGGQPAPVFIGIRLINPDKIIFFYSKDSKIQVNRIKNTLSNYNYEEIEVPPYDFESCSDELKNVLTRYERDEIILNLTSGTKIMSLAAYKIFDEEKREIIYIDSQNHVLIKFNGDEKSVTSKINLILSIKDYFSIYGYPIKIDQKRFESNDVYENIRDIMSKYYFQIKNIISDVNRQINQKKSLIESTDPSGQCYLRYNLKKSKGVLHVSQGRDKYSLEINSQNEFDYINGYWYEDYIFEKLRSSDLFDDIERNVKIYTLKDNLTPQYLNELDVCCIRNQTLYIFECKTGSIDKSIIEKLRLIKTITGTYSKIYLVTLFKPLENTALERIRDFKIELITFKDIDKFIHGFNENASINPNL